MKKNVAEFWQYFFDNISIPICNLAVNLAGFRNCLTEYTVHTLSPGYELLTALVLLNNVARWCNTTQFFTKILKKAFYLLVCNGCWKELFQRGHEWIFPSVSTGANVVKFGFYHSKFRTQPFLLNFSNSCPSSNTHMLACRKCSCHTTKNWVISCVLAPFPIVNFTESYSQNEIFDRSFSIVFLFLYWQR